MFVIKLFVLVQGLFMESFSYEMELKCNEQGLTVTGDENFLEVEELDRRLAVEKLEAKIRYLRGLAQELTTESSYQQNSEELYPEQVESFTQNPSLEVPVPPQPSFPKSIPNSPSEVRPQPSFPKPIPSPPLNVPVSSHSSDPNSDPKSPLDNPAPTQTHSNLISPPKARLPYQLDHVEGPTPSKNPKSMNANSWVSKWYHPIREDHLSLQMLRYCDKLYREGTRRNGVYDVIANGNVIEVFCEFQKGGHNWLVFQRREDGSIDFYKNWTHYVEGFGPRSGEFWIGLSNLYELTRSGSFALRVDLEDFNGNTAYAEYSLFSVEGPSYNYRLRVSGFSGNAGDSLSYHNGFPFSTHDRDNDNHYRGRNCAEDDHGAWWYNSCQHSNLNGEYFPGGVMNIRGIGWYHWKHNHYSMKATSMKFRPK